MRLIIGFVAALIAIMIGAGYGLAEAPPVPTLSGETFTGTPVITLDSCNPATGAGSFSFFATGISTQPYAGIFTETGSVSVAGFNPDLSPPTAAEASFTVTPDPADPNPAFVMITGTKTLDLTAGNDVRCNPSFLGFPHWFQIFAAYQYQATIVTSDGRTCHDEGEANIQLQSLEGFGQQQEDFTETFGPPPFDGDVLSVHVTQFAELLLERLNEWINRRPGTSQETDPPGLRRLLRLAIERRGQCPQRQPAEERAPVDSMT